MVWLAAVLWISPATERVFGFAKNVTHGYPIFTACQVSPSVGGLLTHHGRSLSRELVSN